MKVKWILAIGLALAIVAATLVVVFVPKGAEDTAAQAAKAAQAAQAAQAVQAAQAKQTGRTERPLAPGPPLLLAFACARALESGSLRHVRAVRPSMPQSSRQRWRLAS
jgi:uncharacterized membrane protein